MKVKIETNKQLKELNTFRVDAKAKYFAVVKSRKELKNVLKSLEFKQCKRHMVLGGGSNILFVNNYTGFVIKNEIKGVKKIKETKNHVYIKFGSGEVWDKCVKHCVQLGLGGVENMAYIPGTIGGAAVQNIAAYDQNLEDTVYSLGCINKKTLKGKTFYKKDCDFTYRNSKFKKLKNSWFVTSVTLKLNKKPVIDANYYEKGLNKTSVQGELEIISKGPYTVKNVYHAITSLRKKRIPEFKEFPNPGSFFRNPVVTKKKFLEIKKEIPTLQFYTVDSLRYPSNDKLELGSVKISYGQLIDLGLGLKGYKKGNVGIHPNHGAFIYSNGKATGEEIYYFSQEIKQKIYSKYKIELKEEVKIIT